MNKVIEMKFGSALYGTSTPKSDVDLKAIYLPTPREIVLGNYKKTISKSRSKAEFERNNKDDIDIEIFSLDRFLELLCEGQTVALDMLFAPENMYIATTRDGLGIMSLIKANSGILITKNVNSFIGYSRMQAARYGIKGSRMDALKRVAAVLEDLSAYGSHTKLSDYPTTLTDLVKECESLISLEKTALVEICMLKGPNKLIDQPHLHVNGRFLPLHSTVKWAKEVVGKMLEGYGGRAKKAYLAGGYDYKALSHAVRVNSEAVELLTTGKITFPRPDRELLLKIKLGELPYQQVAEMIEQGLADLYVANEKSTLPEKPDKAWADDLVYYVYSQIVKKRLTYFLPCPII